MSPIRAFNIFLTFVGIPNETHIAEDSQFASTDERKHETFAFCVRVTSLEMIVSGFIHSPADFIISYFLKSFNNTVLYKHTIFPLNFIFEILVCSRSDKNALLLTKHYRAGTKYTSTHITKG